MLLPTAPLGTNGLQLGLMTWHCLALAICTYCTYLTCSRFADMSYDLSSSSFSEILEGHVGPVASGLRCGTKCRIDIDLASVRSQKACVKARESHKSCVHASHQMLEKKSTVMDYDYVGQNWEKNVDSAPFSLAFGRWFFQNSCSNSCWVTVRACLAWTQKAEEQQTWVYWLPIIQISRDIVVAASLHPLYWHYKCCCIPEVEWGGDSLVWDVFPFGISGAFFPGSSALVHFSVLHLRVENKISNMLCVGVRARQDIKQDDFSYSNMSPRCKLSS